MTDHGDAATRESFEAAVRSFTEAELALGEIVNAAQRFRSASDAIVDARAALDVSHESLVATMETLRAMASEMERLSASLAAAASVLAALDPERVWSSFAQLESAVGQSSQELARQIETSVADMAAASKAASDNLAREIGQVRRLAVHARAAAVTAVALGIATTVLLAARLLGLPA